MQEHHSGRSTIMNMKENPMRSLFSLKNGLPLPLACMLLLGSAIVPASRPAEAAAEPLPVPALTITELVADSANTNNASGASVDGYEFIEIYNNSGSAVPLKGYKILYINGSSTSTWTLDKEDLTVPPRDTAVLWVKSPGLSVSLDAFNANYGSSVTPDKFSGLSGQGLANSGARTVVLATYDGLQLSSATYNVPTNETAMNQSIVYQYPADGTNVMRKAASKQTATPGTILPGQAPEAAAPSAPSGLTAADRRPGGPAQLDPASGSDISRYRVVMNGAFTDIVTTGTSARVTGLTNFKEYSFSVVAISDTAGQMSAPSAIVKARPEPDVIDSVPPQAPNGLAATAGQGQVTLTWSPNPEPDVAGYRVYKDGAAAPSATVNASTYSAVVGSLTGGLSYSFQVTAFDASGNESAKSSAVTAVPQHQRLTQEETGVRLPGDFPQYDKFFDVSAPGPIVPGLLQGLVPQGMHYYKDKNWIIISSYRDDRRPSTLTIVDAGTGAFVKTIHLFTQEGQPFSGHAGAWRSVKTMFGSLTALICIN
ncbi:lamin tail domain-containing protein [Paenibacillus sp. P26]|nr:lamin tail domain-containing protein [Paenibacillus sp. P26]